VIVRWGLDALPEVLGELDAGSPLLVAGPRWDALDLPLEPHARWSEVPSHRIDDAAALGGAGDSVVAVGGGSAIDLGKAISAAAEIPLVSVPDDVRGSRVDDVLRSARSRAQDARRRCRRAAGRDRLRR